MCVGKHETVICEGVGMWVCMRVRGYDQQSEDISALAHERVRCEGVLSIRVGRRCRDGANAQYMQYLSKSRVTSPQTR